MKRLISYALQTSWICGVRRDVLGTEGERRWTRKRGGGTHSETQIDSKWIRNNDVLSDYKLVCSVENHKATMKREKNAKKLPDLGWYSINCSYTCMYITLWVRTFEKTIYIILFYMDFCQLMLRMHNMYDDIQLYIINRLSSRLRSWQKLRLLLLLGISNRRCCWEARQSACKFLQHIVSGNIKRIRRICGRSNNVPYRRRQQFGRGQMLWSLCSPALSHIHVHLVKGKVRSEIAVRHQLHVQSKVCYQFINYHSK